MSVRRNDVTLEDCKVYHTWFPSGKLSFDDDEMIKIHMMSRKPSLSLAALHRSAIILCPVAARLLFE